MPLTKHHKLGHKRYMNGLSVKFCSHFCSLRYIAAIHEPESCRDSCGETDTIIDKRKRCGACHILPLGTRCAACKYQESEITNIILYILWIIKVHGFWLPFKVVLTTRSLIFSTVIQSIWWLCITVLSMGYSELKKRTFLTSLGM